MGENNPVRDRITLQFSTAFPETSSTSSASSFFRRFFHTPSWILLDIGNPPNSSKVWLGIVGDVFRASMGTLPGPAIVAGNLYSSTMYVDAPLRMVKKSKPAGFVHNVLIEFRPDAGTLRLWVDQVLYGVGNTIQYLPVLPMAWVNATGAMVDSSQIITYYEHQSVSLGTHIIPPGLPGLMPVFGVNVGATLPSFRA